ncbi:hypothetical protein BGW38_008741 [Lunasporangiospora selenospora]|uniref:Uncharacterized protein n=1 Tax=Lunasporangiospora selenospora TaxID=979761 RepID=A0A9P6FXP4_9FUNG|nr:hypothetical protein BGW38_008741 [Lunasporangiospora selenospora]
MLLFIVARVLTTRGFASFKPGFNTRAIVTWLAVMSLTLMVLYSAMLARILYKQSMAGYFPGPKPHFNYEPPSPPANVSFPINVEFRDMAKAGAWDLSGISLPDEANLYYILAMKPIALYSNMDQEYLFALRIVMRVSQCSLMACLLLLNTYWCHHVEVLVDEGDFMSKTEMYLYWSLAGIVFILPTVVFVGVGFGLDKWKLASMTSDLIMLILGFAIILGYSLTSLRLRALELPPEKQPVLAHAVNDLLGALWNTIVLLTYPAAMFLLYPSVDNLTKHENDPAARFQRRVRRTVKDAKRIRESMYLEGELTTGVESANHSSLHGLTSHPGPGSRQPDSGQLIPLQQRFEPMRRERMGSITAMVNEMALIIEEEGGGSIEMLRSSGDKDTSTTEVEEPNPSLSIGSKTPEESRLQLSVNNSGRSSSSPSNFYEDQTEVEMMKRWLAKHDNVDRSDLISGLEQTMVPERSPSIPALSVQDTSFATITADAFASFKNNDRAAASATNVGPTPNVDPLVQSESHPVCSKLTGSPGRPTPIPLAGILKTRNSTSSNRSSFGQNPLEPSSVVSTTSTPSSQTRPAVAPPVLPPPVYGTRTSSVLGAQQMMGARKSSESVRRKSSGAGTKSSVPATVTSSPPGHMVESSYPPSPQQRRSNVTTRVDAGALALAAQQQQYQKSRTSRDGAEHDYFGLRKPSSEQHLNPTSPLPLSVPPPPIPTSAASSRPGGTGHHSMPTSPTTPTTPTTPPGVRPRRSMENVMDPQFIEMANRLYGNHIVAARLLQTVASSPRAPPPTGPLPSVPALPIITVEEQGTTQHSMSPPAKSPNRPRESFESKVGAGPSSTLAGVPMKLLQEPAGLSTPPSPASPTSTASPTILSATTLPRPLTPAWQETKTSVLSTGNVLDQYRAIVRAGSFQRQKEQEEQLQHRQQQKPQQLPPQRPQRQKEEEFQSRYYSGQSIGPLDAAPSSDRLSHNPSVTLSPLMPSTQSSTLGYLQEPPTRSQQQRMASTDSFGVVRRNPSHDKEDSTLPIIQPHVLEQDHHRHQLHQRQHQPQIDRHSFMMPSENLSVYSTWTGELSDVTNTSGEVSVGAFLDRKSSHTAGGGGRGGGALGTSQHKVGGEKSSGTESSSMGTMGTQSSGDDHDVRKSQASAYSMGSSFGVGSSARQSAGAYSSYSSHSGQGSGPIVVSAALSSVGQPSGNNGNNLNNNNGQTGNSNSNTVGKRQSGSLKKASGGGQGSTGSGGGASSTESTENVGRGGHPVKDVSLTMMNSMRLSAFGPGEDRAESHDEEEVQGGDSRASGAVSKKDYRGAGSSPREFHPERMDEQTSQELERVVQQEWMERRAAVKKDSKSRLEQLQREHQQRQESTSEGQTTNQQNPEPESQASQGAASLQSTELEPYTLNSIYFKSTAELELGLSKLGPASSIMRTPTMLTTLPMTSTFPTASPPMPPSASPAWSVATSTAATTTTANTSATPSPQVAPLSSSTASQSQSSKVTSRPPPGPIEDKTGAEYGAGHGQGYAHQRPMPQPQSSCSGRRSEDWDDGNTFIQSSSSYARHHRQNQSPPSQSSQSQFQPQPQQQPQQQQPLQQARSQQPLSQQLLHYDSIDSIATIREVTHHPSTMIPSTASPTPMRQQPLLPSQMPFYTRSTSSLSSTPVASSQSPYHYRGASSTRASPSPSPSPSPSDASSVSYSMRGSQARSPPTSPGYPRPLHGQAPSPSYQQQQQQGPFYFHPHASISSPPSSPRSPTSTGTASLTVLGPSRYRITPEDDGEPPFAEDSRVSAASASTTTTSATATAHLAAGAAAVAARSMSPYQRTSSRMTNLTSLTNPESEYQWESAEIEQHRWEMLESPYRRGDAGGA